LFDEIIKKEFNKTANSKLIQIYGTNKLLRDKQSRKKKFQAFFLKTKENIIEKHKPKSEQSICIIDKATAITIKHYLTWYMPKWTNQQYNILMY